MLKKYNKTLLLMGDKLRKRILFDILESIDYHHFFKIKFQKEQQTNDLILKFI